MPTNYNVLTGWRGVIVCDDSDVGDLRFTSENIDVPLAVEVDDSVHSGIRTSSVYYYSLVKPTGDVTFPLLSDNVTSVAETIDLSSQMKTILTRAIQPHDSSATTALPILDEGNITVHRGDSKKILTEPWISTLKVSGTTNNKIEVSVGLKALYGEVVDETAAPTTTFGKARAIMFNELDWTQFTADVASSVYSETTSVPRQFDITIDNGIQDDDTPNSDTTTFPDRVKRVRAMRGFALGYQSIAITVTYVGKALPKIAGVVSQHTIPIGGTLDIGGLYTVSDGIWTVRSLPMPGNNEIAISNFSFKGMLAADNTQNYPVNPGSLLL